MSITLKFAPETPACPFITFKIQQQKIHPIIPKPLLSITFFKNTISSKLLMLLIVFLTLEIALMKCYLSINYLAKKSMINTLMFQQILGHIQ